MTEAKIALRGYYITEQLYASSRTLVYRARREIDRQPVVIKLLQNEYPSFSELVQFRNQYTIAKNLNLPGIVRPYSLDVYLNGYILVMEDVDGISLTQYAQTKGNTCLPIGEFLAIAVQLAVILDGLYRHRVIHKDLKPANILINLTTKQVKLIDFGIASVLPRETQEIQNPNVLQGTLAYVSPEQTGRMNRGIDYRTDFYSLGVTFYQLLTGQLPFQVNDPMELVHCHLAKQATPVSMINSTIPQVLSQLVAKLMAKNAEDRYQSAIGLEHDLEICLYQWKMGTLESFELGQRDVSDRFLIPEKLYGRELAVNTLLDAFDRVACPKDNRISGVEPHELGFPPKSEIMLVAGFSGIGKTAVINEVHKPIVRQRGYFIKGKYDQFQRNIPLNAFVQAFRDLVGQLLSESKTQLAQWQTKILEVVGESGQVLIEVIPELEYIIGPQLPIPELSGTAAQNRFNLLFQKFIKVFSTQTHPLVIFLDDLQWADSASLKLMQLLMTDTKHLLLIGAYRDNEVNPAHPLMLTLTDIKRTQTVVNTITLTSLQQADLNQLVADTFNCSLELAYPLTELMYQKTKGNPFFSTQFLKSLYTDGAIAFNVNQGGWQFDITQVRSLTLTENVVEFMALQLKKLPINTQELLKLAACIGNQFDLATLAIVYEKSQVDTASNLWAALQEGLVLPIAEIYKFYQDDGNSSPLTVNCQLSANYKFLHDRVQQAAYLLIRAEQRKATHLKIGQLLLSHIEITEQEDRIFDILNHLNVEIASITEQAGRDELARLNFIAGKKAKLSTAFAAAFGYLNTAMQLLAVDSWQKQYEFTLTLYNLAAETAYLCSEFEQMQQWVEVILTQTHTPLDRVTAYEVTLQAYAVQNRMLEALTILRQAMQPFGVEFPEQPTQNDIQQAFEETTTLLAGKTIEDLFNLPAIADPEQLAIMRLAASAIGIANVAGSLLFPLLILTQVKLTIQRGNTAISAYGYALYGILLISFQNDIEAAYQFGQLALRLVEKFDAKQLKAKVCDIVGGFISHGKVPLKETLHLLQEGYQAGLETGDLEFVGYISKNICYTSLFAGEELTTLELQMRAYATTLANLKQVTSLNYTEIYWQAVLNLLGQAKTPWQLSGEAAQEQTLLPLLQQANDFIGLHFLFTTKLMLCYTFGEFDKAKDVADRGKQYLFAGSSFATVPIFYFYDSLTVLTGNANCLQQVSENQEKLQHWAHHAPMNYQHKYELVEAERYRVLGQPYHAMEHYDRAIALAQKHEFLSEEALANELAAKFYLEVGKPRIAQSYLIDAYYAYTRWGAKAKIATLEQHYGQLLAPILQSSLLTQNNSLSTFSQLVSIHHTLATDTSSSTSNALDTATLLKAAQALYSEIHLDRLISTLMQVAIENAGADKAALLLIKAGELEVTAQYFDGVASTLQPKIVDNCEFLPINIIYYVQRTLETVVANTTDRFRSDPYLIQQNPQSWLCTPIVLQGKPIGILYLENSLVGAAFTSDRVELLKFLCSQAAISLENARLYQQAQQAIEDLKQAQLQLVQQEKMSALGNLVAGVAHEINNPVGFLAGNLQPAQEYIKDLFDLIDLYQQEFPNPGAEIEERIEAIHLEYVQVDLPKLLSSMKEGIHRIRSISTSLRTFSRTDTEHKMPFNLHDGIDSTILILRHRLKASNSHPEIKVIKEYGDLPLVQCFPGQLNQVFMNILGNAIDALEDSNQGLSFAEIEANPNQIVVKTEYQDKLYVIIRIRDNGIGMTEAVKAKVFNQMFTTKPVGKGTGLGLAIAHQIVVEKHGGTLEVNSVLGQGAEFVIQLPLN